MNQSTLEENVMLSIAKTAIANRAALDDYAPGTYDAKHDPEGYITSLINALHQWCHTNGIDWEHELSLAQGFFEQDLAELASPETPTDAPAITELRCPDCEHEESFVIEVSERLLMFKDGVVLHGDDGEEWGDRSYCHCHKCNRAGTVFQFRANDGKQEGVHNG